MKDTNYKWKIVTVIAVTLALLALVIQDGGITSVSANNGTVSPAPTIAGKLASCSVLPDTASLQPGQTQTFTYTAMDKNSAVISGVVVTWSMSGISGVLSTTSGITNSSGQATTDFLGTVPGGTVTVTATGMDTTTNQTCKPSSNSVVTVTLPTPTPTAVPGPAEVTPTPAAAPATTPVPPEGATQAYVTPQEKSTVSTPDSSSSVTIPAGALSTSAFVTVMAQSSGDVPSLPAGFALGSKIVDISFKDVSGNSITIEAKSPITVTLNLDKADVDQVLAGGQIAILRYDTILGQWVELNTTVDLANRTATTKVSRFSSFALTLKAQPGAVLPTATPEAIATAAPTPTAKPPDTGDVSPSSGLLAILALAGLMVALGGGYFLRRSRS